MKGAHLVLILLVSGSLCINFLDFHHMPQEKPIKSQTNTKTHMEEVKPGLGYNSAKQTLVNVECFSVWKEIINGDHSEVDFAKAQGYDSMTKSLGLDLEIKGGYGYFTGSVAAGYSREVSETNTQLSFNFFSKSTHKVNYEYNYGPKLILSEKGQKAYSLPKNQFIDICGDNVVKQYERGTALVMSMILEFNSSKEMNEFRLKLGFGVLGIVELSIRIRVAIKETKINGNVKIKAIQLGGDPSQLSRIIDDKIKDCNLLQFDECLKVANKIIDYASGDYVRQLTDKNKFIPMGTFSLKRISDFGLPSINPLSYDIIESRDWMVSNFKKIDYYNFKLSEFIRFYPGYKRPEFSELVELADSVKSIYEEMNGSEGGKVCWNEPNKCVETKENFEEAINGLFDNEEKIINQIQTIRYSDIIDFGFLQGTNTCRINSVWPSYQPEKVRVFPTPDQKWIFTINNELIEGVKVNNNTIELKVNKDKYPYLTKLLRINYTEEQTIINGSVTCQEGGISHNAGITGRRLTGDYFMELYDGN